MTNPKTDQIRGQELTELVALRRDMIAAVDRMLAKQPLMVDEVNVICGLVQAYSMLANA